MSNKIKGEFKTFYITKNNVHVYRQYITCIKVMYNWYL